MTDQFTTTKYNIALLSYLIQAIDHIVSNDPNILSVAFDGEFDNQVHLAQAATNPDFFNSLQVPFVIQARDSDSFPWVALAHHDGLAVFRILTDDQLHTDFHMHPSSFDQGDDDDPGEHFMDDNGRPKGYELEQEQADYNLELRHEAELEARLAGEDRFYCPF